MVKKTGDKEYEEELSISCQEPLKFSVDGMAPRQIEDVKSDISGGFGKSFAHELVPKEAFYLHKETKSAWRESLGDIDVHYG